MTVNFSIIMPCFNAEAYLRRAVESVMAQSYENWELIIVDDCSTDASRTLAQEFALADDRIKAVTLEHNAGPSGARNAGIAMASGDWIALLDADDRWRQDRLENAVRHFALQDIDMFVDNLVFVNDQADVLGCAFEPSSRYRMVSFGDVIASEMPLRRFRYGFLKPFFRRSFLAEHKIGYDEAVRHSEDFLLLCQCLLKGARSLLSYHPAYIYAVPTTNRASASTQHMDETLRQRRHVAARLIALAAETGSKPVMNQAQAFDRHIRRLEAGRSIFTALRTGRLNRLKLADIFNMHGLLIFVSSLPRIKKWTGREMRNGFRP